jgi:hypothetical protein
LQPVNRCGDISFALILLEFEECVCGARKSFGRLFYKSTIYIEWKRIVITTGAYIMRSALEVLNSHVSHRARLLRRHADYVTVGCKARLDPAQPSRAAEGRSLKACGARPPLATRRRPCVNGVQSCIEKRGRRRSSSVSSLAAASAPERARGQAVHREAAHSDREEQHRQHDLDAAGRDLAPLTLVVHEVDHRHGSFSAGLASCR